ncbi:unnamed protein product [Paramecium primaurelia]|uniref:PRELI/MSF1 domain-containing protein n=1 Tax=Paramecium primaurelia TaxID=5886 RepID=A0A8S1N6P9_PARPR|nr:unnamed protein product [Paramecium primaurelia]
MKIHSEYTFNYNWETVIKGFWRKYPCKEFDFIKFNQVVDMILDDNNKIQIKRIVYANKFTIWCLTLEQITIDLENRSMEMQTKLLKSCKLYPNLTGDESIIYKAIDNQQTHYSKLLSNFHQTFLTKLISQFNTSFKKGIEVVEARCRELQNNK